MRKLKIKKVSKGFTLVEVLVSLSILSILILVFFNVINISIKNNKKNEVDINALNLARSEIENIRTQIKNNISDIKDLENNEIITGESNSYLYNNYKVDILLEKKSDLLYEINVGVKHQNFDKNTQIITQVVIGIRNSN